MTTEHQVDVLGYFLEPLELVEATDFAASVEHSELFPFQLCATVVDQDHACSRLVGRGVVSDVTHRRSEFVRHEHVTYAAPGGGLGELTAPLEVRLTAAYFGGRLCSVAIHPLSGATGFFAVTADLGGVGMGVGVIVVAILGALAGSTHAEPIAVFVFAKGQRPLGGVYLYPP